MNNDIYIYMFTLCIEVFFFSWYAPVRIPAKLSIEVNTFSGEFYVSTLRLKPSMRVPGSMFFKVVVYIH
jgi:hypothetical protein